MYNNEPFRTGDMVRLTHEGKVDYVGPRWLSVTSLDGKRVIHIDTNNEEIELIARVDHPSNDPVGSFREFVSDNVFKGRLYFKGAEDCWSVFGSSVVLSDRMMAEGNRTRRVTVTVGPS